MYIHISWTHNVECRFSYFMKLFWIWPRVNLPCFLLLKLILLHSYLQHGYSGPLLMLLTACCVHPTVPYKSTIGRDPPSCTHLFNLFSLPSPPLFFSTYSNLARHVSSVLFIIPQLLSSHSAASSDWNLLYLNISPPQFYLELQVALHILNSMA